MVDALLRECWEPAAEAALLTLCVNKFGLGRVTKALRARSSDWPKRRMRDEWDYRASRSGVLSVMSVRYPYDQLNVKSAKYVNAVMRFIGSDLNNKDVLEIGSGVGRLSKQIVKVARKLTCIDLSDRMITRCKSELDRDGARSKRDFDRHKGRLREPEYFMGFAQDYPRHRHDVAISSLVLIHNVDDSEFAKLVAKMCECASMIFVFEDVTQTRPSSPHTRIRSKGELRAAFADHGFLLQQPDRTYRLLADEVAFMKFVRTDTHTASACD